MVDQVGACLNADAYSGALRERFMSGPSGDQPASHGLETFLGNAAFLQAIRVSVYGSNGPLWSLANEFWYYLLFPLVITAF